MVEIKIFELAKKADDHAWKQFPDKTTYPADWQAIRDVEFAQLVAKECRTIYNLVDNGNKVKGTTNYLKALYLTFLGE